MQWPQQTQSAKYLNHTFFTEKKKIGFGAHKIKKIKFTKPHRLIYHAIWFSVGELLQLIQYSHTIFFIKTTQTTKQKLIGSLWKYKIWMDNKGPNRRPVFPFIPQTWLTVFFLKVERTQFTEYSSEIYLLTETMGSMEGWSWT